MTSNLLISIIDLMTITLITLFIAVMAITYDEDKGLGDHDFISITSLNGLNNISGDLKKFDFHALTLGTDDIKLSHYKQGKNKYIESYKSVKQLEMSKFLDPKIIYVIYEKSENHYLDNIVRLFALKGVPIGIARAVDITP